MKGKKIRVYSKNDIDIKIFDMVFYNSVLETIFHKLKFKI